MIHVSETASEVAQLIEKTGKTPVRYLESLGLLNKNLLAVHCVVLDDEEIELFKKVMFFLFSVLYSILDSPSELDWQGKILFIEDLDEMLYHIKSDIGKFQISSDSWGGVFILADNNQKAINELGNLLSQDDRFLKEEVDHKKYR